MSLIAAVLSQTNKILGILTNFTGTFPTSTINTINTNTQPAAQATDTQTGLTNQGYTVGRAALLPNLSNLDILVSSRSKQLATKAEVSGGTGSGSFNILSLGGSGQLHSIQFQTTSGTGTGSGLWTININGNVVKTFSTANSSTGFLSLQFEWSASISISVTVSGSTPSSSYSIQYAN